MNVDSLMRFDLNELDVRNIPFLFGLRPEQPGHHEPQGYDERPSAYKPHGHTSFLILLYHKIYILSIRLDSNQGPPRYKLGATTAELRMGFSNYTEKRKGVLSARQFIGVGLVPFNQNTVFSFPKKCLLDRLEYSAIHELLELFKLLFGELLVELGSPCKKPCAGAGIPKPVRASYEDQHDDKPCIRPFQKSDHVRSSQGNPIKELFKM